MKLKLVILLPVLVCIWLVPMHGQVSTSIDLQATVWNRGNPLTLSVNSSVIFDQLHPGVSYRTVSDFVSSVTNIIPWSGTELFSPAEIVISGNPGENFLFTCKLPASLFPSSGVGYVRMTYDQQSGNWLDASSGMGRFFNPLQETPITLDNNGEALIFLGGNPTVSEDAQTGDEFLGYGLIVAEYSGVAL